MSEEVASGRPFHETIVEALHRVGTSDANTAYALIDLLHKTVIPENHEAILEALLMVRDTCGIAVDGAEHRIRGQMYDLSRRKASFFSVGSI